MKKLTRIGLAAIGATMLASTAYAADYTIGVSNTVQGNGWREEMICAIKAQALASGKVATLNIAHRNTDAAGQLEDIRNLISARVNAIVVNPADPAGIQAALKEATDAGIVVVAVDQAVTEPSAYIISNNQEEYAYLGAKWLFEQIGGKGNVVYMRGAAGASADSDRDKGFKRRSPNSRTSRSRRRSSPAGSRTRASSRSSTTSPPACRSTASGPRASTT